MGLADAAGRQHRRARLTNGVRPIHWAIGVFEVAEWIVLGAVYVALAFQLAALSSRVLQIALVARYIRIDCMCLGSADETARDRGSSTVAQR